MIAWVNVFGLIGMTGICIALVVLAALSRRLGHATGAPPYFLGLYAATGLVALGVVARLIHIDAELATLQNLHENSLWVLLYNGAPAIGVTLALIIAWRYWSWLLAERD
ncbi:hypothetical protein HC928_16570 [bacterium]|nr:hypothetical protein [bacterium]